MAHGAGQTYRHFIVFADGDAADAVLLAQLLAQRGAHDLPSDVRGSREVSPSVLASGRGD